MKNFDNTKNAGEEDYEVMRGDVSGSDKSNPDKLNFAENLQYLRKQKDITQEQLAEQLEVSRQSVSKWESGQSYPEMEKLLQLCGMFRCNMDILLRGDVRSIFTEDVYGYDKFQNKFNKLVAGGVGLILLGLGIMLLLSGAGMSEMLCGAIFWSFLIIAVLIFIVMGLQKDRFCQKNPVIEDFYIEEEKERSYRNFTVRIAVGVGIILTDVLFCMVFGEKVEIIPDPALAERAESALMGIFLLMIAVAVTILVYGGLDKEKYNIKGYNEEANPSPEKKKRNALIGKLCACIMLVAVIIYLILNLVVNFGMAWIAFVIGGILCGMVAVVLSKSSGSDQG